MYSKEGSDPAKEKTPILNRRSFLRRGRDVLAGLIAAPIISSIPFSETTPTVKAGPSNQETFDKEVNSYWENFDWDNLRERINSLPDYANEYKRYALPLVDRLEFGSQNILPSLDDFFELYGQQVGSDGKTPLMVELTQGIFGKTLGNNPRSAYFVTEERTPFLKDRKDYINIFAWFVTNQSFYEKGTPTLDSTPEGIKNWAEGVQESLDKLEEKYTNVGLLRSEGEIEFKTGLDTPLSGEGSEQFEMDKLMIEELINKKPWIKQLLVNFVLYGGERYGQSRAEEIQNYGGHFHPDFHTGVITLNLENSAASPDLESVLLHEVGHMLDPLVNPSLIYFFTPEQLVGLVIKRQQALLDLQWGRVHPNLDQMFDRGDFYYPGDKIITPAKFRTLNKGYPNSIIRTGTYGATGYTVRFAEIFDPPFKSISTPFASQTQQYPDFIHFVNENRQTLEQLFKSGNRNIKVALGKILTNPSRFNESYRVSAYNGLFNPSDKTAKGYWDLICYGITNAIYIDAFFKGDPEVVNLYSEKGRDFFTPALLDFIGFADQEYFAEAFSRTNLFKDKMDESISKNPFLEYLEEVETHLT